MNLQPRLDVARRRACRARWWRRTLLLVAIFGTTGVSGRAGAAEAPTSKSGSRLKPSTSIELAAGVRMEFVLIPSGDFMMGDSEGDPDEKPAHRITISKPFYMGKHEVTQEQWGAVMGNNPSKYQAVGHPVEWVSWKDCQAFFKNLQTKVPTRAIFRLPTEAEWEYACRAGTSGRYSYGSDSSMLSDYAWFDQNAGGPETHPVGRKKPNPWGLFDMHGNVTEWCADWYDSKYYQSSPPLDPSGPGNGGSRVVRGGGWVHEASKCRSTYRCDVPQNLRFAFIGFRVVVEPQP